MSGDPNISPVSNQKFAYNLIRMAFALIAGLAVTFTVTAVVAPFLGLTLDAGVQTIVGMSITGFFGFIAGRKS